MEVMNTLFDVERRGSLEAIDVLMENIDIYFTCPYTMGGMM